MDPTETDDPRKQVETAHAALLEAGRAAAAARETFEDAMRAANDAGNSYRKIAEWVPYGYHYVGDLITSSRERAETEETAA